MSDPKPTLEPFSPGTVLSGRYEVVRQVGKGGTGQVLEVKDRALENDRLALKIIHPGSGPEADPNFASRFRNEVIITRKLTHPNIVRTFDFGELSDGRLFMTMEFVDGCTLDKLIPHRIEEGRNLELALYVLERVASAIGYAHSQGIIHRDLKTANILVNKTGEIKITDFGLAQMRNFDKQLTLVGECVGTPMYMAPEQIRGEKADCTVDIYALGIVAYEMFVGHPPFRADTWYDLAIKIVTEEIPAPRTNTGLAPEWYSQLIKRATAKNRDSRFQNTSDFVSFMTSSQSMPIFPSPQKRLVSDPNSAILKLNRGKVRVAPVAACLVALLLLLSAGLARDLFTPGIPSKMNVPQPPVLVPERAASQPEQAPPLNAQFDPGPESRKLPAGEPERFAVTEEERHPFREAPFRRERFLPPPRQLGERFPRLRERVGGAPRRDASSMDGRESSQRFRPLR